MMIVTEEQAKKKRCCEALEWEQITDCTFQDTVIGAVREAKECIASTCMAWRWDKKSKTKIDPTEMEYTKRIDVTKKEWLGYCGKAGKPEV